MYMVETIVVANELFSSIHDSKNAESLARFRESASVGEAAQKLGLIDVLEQEYRQPMADFLGSIPPSIDAAAMAAVRSALDRGVRVQITWQPGYEFEVRVWDVTEGSHGLVNVFIISRDPEMPTRD